MDAGSDGDDDCLPILSEEAANALEEFFATNKSGDINVLRENSVSYSSILKGNELTENWQLSQFWYSDATSSQLAEEISNETPTNGKIALIGCPSLYYYVKQIVDDINDGAYVSFINSFKLFDIDSRFSAYNGDFFKYDYNYPLQSIPVTWKNAFDMVVVDPPFLSEECLTKLAVTIEYISKDKLIICSGAVMENLIKRLFGANRTHFLPRHKSNLGNEFACFVNYVSESSTFSYCDKMSG